LEKHNAWYWDVYENKKRKMIRLGSSRENEPDYLANKQAACNKANELHAEREKLAKQQGQQQEAPPTGNITIAEYAECEYLPWAQRNKAASTYHCYRKIWNNPLKAHFGRRKLNEYRPYMATAFLGSLALVGQGRNTIAHTRAVMSGIFAHAVGGGHLELNPIAGAQQREKVKEPEETQHYELSEMALILAALDREETARQHSVMALAFIGLRRGEISGLRWADVNLANGSLWVRRSAWQGIAAERPKNRKSIREVTLGTVVTKSLTRLRRLYAPINDYVFENEAGNPLDLGLYSARVLRPTLSERGVNCWKGYHSGRRGVETEMQRYTNGNSQITSYHFGHSKEVADAHYIKPLPDETKRAALAFDAALATLLADNSGQIVQ
jgi:integrase